MPRPYISFFSNNPDYFPNIYPTTPSVELQPIKNEWWEREGEDGLTIYHRVWTAPFDYTLSDLSLQKGDDMPDVAGCIITRSRRGMLIGTSRRRIIAEGILFQEWVD